MEYTQRGYLTGDFRLFRLEDSASVGEIDFHFHEFHKLLRFRGGEAGYCIEGLHYLLQPGDLVLVPQGAVHRPEVGASVPYSRDVLYLSPAFCRDGGLDRCFQEATAAHSFLLRPREPDGLQSCFQELAESLADSEAFAAPLWQRLSVQRLLIRLARAQAEAHPAAPVVYDALAARLLQYIRDNLTGDVSADTLAARFYVSKYHLMRLFRQETGYSIHRYVSDKRLLYARELIAAGVSPTDSCFRCGYRDYSAFARAYKKQFGIAPKVRT